MEASQSASNQNQPNKNSPVSLNKLRLIAAGSVIAVCALVSFTLYNVVSGLDMTLKYKDSNVIVYKTKKKEINIEKLVNDSPSTFLEINSQYLRKEYSFEGDKTYSFGGEEKNCSVRLVYIPIKREEGIFGGYVVDGEEKTLEATITVNSEQGDFYNNYSIKVEKK